MHIFSLPVIIVIPSYVVNIAVLDVNVLSKVIVICRFAVKKSSISCTELLMDLINGKLILATSIPFEFSYFLTFFLEIGSESVR